MVQGSRAAPASNAARISAGGTRVRAFDNPGPVTGPRISNAGLNLRNNGYNRVRTVEYSSPLNKHNNHRHRAQ